MDEASPSDVELIDRARDGEVEAFGDLVQRHQDYVYNAVCHLLGGRQDADDIAQDVFVQAYRGLGGFRGQSRFTTWLYRIMLNTVRTHWRRQRSRKAYALSPPNPDDEAPHSDPPAGGDSPVEATMRGERVQAVQQAIAALDEDLREVVVLRDIRGLSYAELAETIGVPTGTVKSRLHRGRLALKEILEPLFGDVLETGGGLLGSR